LMRSLSRGMNFGGVYLDLIKNIRTVASFSATQTQGAEGQEGRLAIAASALPLRRRKTLTVGLLLTVLARPSQDPLVADANGNFLTIKVFEQRNRILA
jgi:hypothetical protein